MGLLQDVNGIPITYGIFPGNTNDSTTLMPLLKELKSSMSLTGVVVVADKGINTSNNIAACLLDGNDYVFSQSIRGTKSTERTRKWVLSDKDYQVNADGSYRAKSRQETKTIHIKDDDGKTIRDVDVEVKVVAFWSKKYETRARRKREKVIEKSLALVNNPSDYTRATHFGAAKYVKNISFDKTTGEVIEDAGKQAVLDTDAIKRDALCDGYYCIITSKTDWSDEQIITTYKELWRIEDAFRVSKSDLKTRPIFVSLQTHIQAHFLSCYIAITILRLMQYDLSRLTEGSPPSARAIIDDLSAMSGTREDANYWLFDHRSDLSDDLAACVGIDLSLSRYTLREIKDLFAQVNDNNQD